MAKYTIGPPDPPAPASDAGSKYTIGPPDPPADAGTWYGALGTGFAHGLGNLLYGGAQLGARMQEPTAFSDPDPTLAARVDEATRAREKAYQADPVIQAHPTAAGVGDISGEIAASTPLFLLPGGALPTLPARIAGSALAGGVLGLAQPVTTEGGYGAKKAEQVGSSALAGAVFEPVGEAAAKVVGSGVRGVKRLFQTEETKAAEKAAARTEKAGELVTARVTEAQKAGRLQATDVMREIDEARAAGQPFTLLDVDAPGGPVRRLGGTVYRGPGGAGAHMEGWQTGRMTAIDEPSQRTQQGLRLVQGVREKLASGSALEAAATLATRRSENARPLWDKAMEGGSIAPLEHQFTQEFQTAAQAEAIANQRLVQARQKLAPAAGKAVTGYDVYTSSAANRAQREAASEVALAERQLAQAHQVKEDVRPRLERARADGTANAPGAVWSPRLQEFLDAPEVKQGLRHGWRQERLNALAEGRAPNPSEYAITGFDESGDPIVGQVPNMKLLQMAKQGIDHQLLTDKGLYDQFGQKTKDFYALDKVRRAFIDELDRLNPDYAPARAQWSGDSSMMQALQDGSAAMARPPRGLKVEEFAARWREMSPGEREMFKLGIADHMIQDLDFARLTSNDAKALINSTATLQRLRMLFGAKEEFDQFVKFVGRERTMWETGTDVMRGSQTAVRDAADAEAAAAATAAASNAAHGVVHLKAGNYFGAARSFLRAKSDLGWGRQDPELNLEISRLLTDPDVKLAPGPRGRLIVGPRRPPRRRVAPYVGTVSGDIGAIVAPGPETIFGP